MIIDFRPHFHIRRTNSIIGDNQNETIHSTEKRKPLECKTDQTRTTPIRLWKFRETQKQQTSRGRLMKSSEGLACISLTSWRILFTAGFFILYLSSAIASQFNRRSDPTKPTTDHKTTKLLDRKRSNLRNQTRGFESIIKAKPYRLMAVAIYWHGGRRGAKQWNWVLTRHVILLLFVDVSFAYWFLEKSYSIFSCCFSLVKIKIKINKLHFKIS